LMIGLVKWRTEAGKALLSTHLNIILCPLHLTQNSCQVQFQQLG
jgi:hypothetical protein